MNSTKPVEIDQFNFTPMPKRFMVWNKTLGRFFNIEDIYPNTHLSDSIEEAQVFTLQDLTVLSGLVGSLDNRYFVIVQSTGLFDKNGQEIFEGSLLKQCMFECKGRSYYTWWIVESAKDGTAAFVKRRIKGARYGDSLLTPDSDMEVIGHILSNPELL